MFVKIDKETLRILAVSPKRPRASLNTEIIETNNIKTINPLYIRVFRDGNSFVVEELSDEEKRLVDERERKKRLDDTIKLLSSITKRYIESYYPEVKQRSDVADKEYHGAALLLINPSYTSDEIYKKCGMYANRLLDKQTTLDEILNTFSEVERKHWEQLIKIAVRVAWVQRVKDVYRQAKKKILAGEFVDVARLNFPKLEETWI